MATKSSLPDGAALYREIRLPETGASFPVTYWDLWFAILLSVQFLDDWDAMLEYFIKEASALSWHRNKAEGVVNHARMLRQTLEQAGLTPDDLLKDADPDFLKRQKAKVKRKLLEFSFTLVSAKSG